MIAVKVKELTKKYKDHLAVNHISFDVNEGEFFALLGENGAGKSTTINILCTILEKTGGEVEIFGHRLGKEDDAIREKIGIVFQNSVLDNKLSVKENLYTRGAYYGLSDKEVSERIKPLIKDFELDEILNQKYEKLSGGQRRRIDIIRALIHNPKILFLDEPTTGLDPMSRKMVWNYINYLRKEKNMTIFLTTHYLEETKEADKVVILEKGKMIAFDTPNNLKNQYASTKLQWYTTPSRDKEKILLGMKFTYEIDHYNIELDNNKDFDFISFLYENKDVIKDFEILKGNMDDVFLNLTGRKLVE